MPYTENFKETVNAVNAIEVPLALLEINHPGLTSPVRVVNDNDDLTHNGNLFQAFGFEIDKPNQPESGQPEAKIVMDNVGKDLMEWLEVSSGGSGATATIKQVLRSTPNVVEYEIQMVLTNITATTSKITARLSFPDVYNRNGMPTTYNKSTAIGLF